MRKIDLREVTTVFICPDHNDQYRERCSYMFKLLNELGFKNIIHYKSFSVPNKYPLNNATYNILQMNLKKPVLILEDDLEFFENVNFIIEVPEKADGVYLGLSKCNFNFQIDTNEFSAKFEPYNKEYIRVINMLGAHAILYLSTEYKQKISKVLKSANDANDVEICKHQNDHKLYALKTPICWQSSKFNKTWIEKKTKFKINIDSSNTNFIDL